jgi:sortase B
MNKKRVIIIICLVIIFLLLSLFIYHQKVESSFDKFILKDELVENVNTNDIYEENITKLQEEYQNKDIVGTLEILDTEFKVPILQSNDNKYYLKHLPNKEYSIMGSIFLDYRVNINYSPKLLIYGHNSSIYKMPFDILENYYDLDYLNNHKYVLLKTKEKVRKYEIFSLYIATTDYRYMDLNFNKDSYSEHLKYLKNESMFQIDTNVNSNDNILILQTCSTHKDYLKYKKKYLVISFHEINID